MMNDIIGHGGGKGGGEQHVHYEATDSLHSISYARVLDLVSEGEILGFAKGLESVYLNGTPVQNPDGSMNFKGVTVDFRPGTQSQDYIPGFPDVENEIGVGVELKSGTPWVHAINNLQLSAIRVTLSVPALSKANTENGDINGNQVDYQVELSTDNGAYATVINSSFNGKTTTPYQRSMRIDLPPATSGWSIRVSRLTPNANSIAIADTTNILSYTEVIDAKLRYPMSAIVGVQVDAKQFQNVPTRSYDLYGRIIQVPSNYDPIARTYSGIWDGTFKPSWTNNPAWVFRDLCLNDRYGLGDRITASQVDKWALYKIARYCDEMVPNGKGGLEPRFTCNLYLQSQKQAYAVLQDIASIFRGISYWGGGSIIASADMPSDPVYVYTAANVIDGKFSRVGSGKNTRATVALVSWNDMDDFGRAKVEYVEDAEGIKRYGIQQISLTAFGCTSQGQAQRVGRWALATSRLETGMITFEVGMDGAIALPGQIVRIADPSRMGRRNGGRIKTAAGRVVTLDKAPVITVDDRLTVILPTGTSETRTVVSTAGDTVTVDSDWSALPVAQSVWSVDRWDLMAPLFKVLSITEKDGLTYTITATQHEPGKFAFVENNTAITPRPQTALNSATQAAPASVTVSAYAVANQRTSRLFMSVSWPAAPGAVAYEGDYQRDNGNWVTIPRQPGLTVDIPDVTPGVYTVRISAVNSIGIRSLEFASAPTTVAKKSRPPSDVGSLSYTLDKFGLVLSWANIADADLYQYEVRIGGTSWDSADFAATVTGTQYTSNPTVAGSRKYWVKAIDSSLNYSANAASTTVVIPGPATTNATATVSGQDFVLAWVATAGTFAIDHFELRYGASWAAGTLVDQVKTAGYSQHVTWGGTRTFWIAGVDVAGNVGTPSSVQVVVANPANVTISSQTIDNNVLLNWSDATTTLPIIKYEIRRGASWVAGVSIGDNGNGRFAGFFEQASGVYTYWVMATDSAGNASTPTSVTSTVSQPPDYILRMDYTADPGGLLYEFSTNGDPMGWTAAGATTQVKDNTFTVTSTGVDPQILRTMNGFILYGCEYPSLQVRLRRIAGTGWDGKVLYATAGHSHSLAYYAATADTAPAIGEEKVITFNLASLTAGGSDWMASVINEIRIDLGTTSADVFEIDWIGLVPYQSSNVSRDGATLYAALTTESWQSHFTSNGWSTPQDQINAGFPFYWEKSNTSGYYEEIVDYGTTLTSTSVTATMTSQTIAGTVTVTPTVSYKLNWLDAWTDAVGVSSVVANNFRYIKLRYDFAATGGANLLAITNINLKLSSKKRRDSGTGTANAADVGGTVVNFNLPFVSASTPFIQATGNQAVFSACDYVATVNPTSFKVLLFDKTGARISGPFSWQCDGVF